MYLTFYSLLIACWAVCVSKQQIGTLVHSDH